MALTRLNNRSLAAVTELPSASTSNFWSSAADLPAGSVIQTKRAALTSSIEGTSDFDIMSVSITPILPDSNILINVYVQWSVITNDGVDWGMRLYRDSTIILGEDQSNYFISGGGVDASDFAGQGSSTYGVNFASKTDLDTGRPSGTSAITYKLRHVIPLAQYTKNVRYMRDGWGGGGGESQRSNCTIIAQEIKA